MARAEARVLETTPRLELPWSDVAFMRGGGYKVYNNTAVFCTSGGVESLGRYGARGTQKCLINHVQPTRGEVVSSMCVYEASAIQHTNKNALNLHQGGVELVGPI